MKKKMVAVWALAAVLCFGTATISALAAEGWAQSGSTWVYYDSNGNKIYNTWKKGADNQWRYLNGEGVMATNAWVESDYYMDSNGIMLTDKWLKLTGDQGEYEWYYFTHSQLSTCIYFNTRRATASSVFLNISANQFENCF